MKKLFEFFKRTPMLIVFICVGFVYGLSALGLPAEINRYAIVTAIGIDLVDENVGVQKSDRAENDAEETIANAKKIGQSMISGSASVGSEGASLEDGQEYKYEISLLTFMPIAQQSFTETYKVVTSKGMNISKALDFAGLKVGRQVGLSHVKMVVVNEKVLQEDVTNALDFFLRNSNLETSTKLVVTDSPAKEFVNVMQQIHSQSSIKVSEVVNFNSNYIYAADASIESFFRGYFGPTRATFVPFLRIEKESQNQNSIGSLEGSSPASGASGDDESGSSSQGASSQDTGVINNGDTLVFKDGKPKILISGVQMKRINFLNGKYSTGTLNIEHVTDESFEDANLSFDIIDKKIKHKVVYENDVPVFLLNMTLTLQLMEVENQNGLKEENVEVFVLSETVLQAAQQKIKEYVAEGLQIMRENQVDLADFYTIMHNSNPVKFQKFLKGLEDKDDYLNHIVFKVGTVIFSK